MALNGVSLTEINDKAAESAEQRSDCTYVQCSLILFYTLRKNKSMVTNCGIGVKMVQPRTVHSMGVFLKVIMFKLQS